MLIAAALVPPTPLLVPGAAGSAAVLRRERDGALGAVARVVAGGPDEVVVVSAGGPDLAGDLRPTLGAAGIPDSALGWPPPAHGTPVSHVAAAVGLLLLRAAGWRGATRVAAAAAGEPTALRARGRELVRTGRTGLVVVAGGSVRRGDAAPLPADAAAVPADDAVLAWLRAPGAEPPVDRATAERLGMDGWGPLQVLAGALAGDGPFAVELASSDPYGAAYLVGSWTAVG